jgi:hypothetical protein
MILPRRASRKRSNDFDQRNLNIRIDFDASSRLAGAFQHLRTILARLGFRHGDEDHRNEEFVGEAAVAYGRAIGGGGAQLGWAIVASWTRAFRNTCVVS